MIKRISPVMRKVLLVRQPGFFFCLLILSSICYANSQESSPAASQLPGTPSQADQERVLLAMRNYAEEYGAKLPNFICEQITSQFEAGRKPTHWHKGDILTAKLVFTGGKEQRTLELVNNKPPQLGGRRWRTPLTTEGEFGILLGNIFDPVTEAKFSWDGWDNFRGHRVAKFNYSVDR